MPFKDLLLHLDASPAGFHRLGFAVALAQAHGAHLSALYGLDLDPTIAALPLTYIGGVDQFESYAKTRDAAILRAQATEARFRELLRREGVRGEWRFVESLTAETLTLQARYADLTILGQVDPEGPSILRRIRLPDEILLASGRPVLVIPYIARYKSLADRVLIAWQPNREGARAIAEARPFLERARAVTVLTVDPQDGAAAERDLAGTDIAVHLARHGIRVETATTITDGISVGDAILNYAADRSADLLVMGGYGHSRAQEWVLGGVTCQILEQMTLPVLMAH